MELHKGQCFQTAAEAQEFIAQFAKAHWHPLRQRNSVTVVSYNKKVSPNSQLPLEIQYQSLNWECKHSGAIKSRGKGKRQTHTFANGCSMQITIVFNRVMGSFVVSTCKLNHNHDVSPDLIRLYPEHRRPSGKLAEDVDNMLSVNGNPSLVSQVLHKEGLAVRVKDMHNRKQVLIKSGSTLTARLRSILALPNVHYRFLETEDHQFQGLFFQTDIQRTLFYKYGEMIQMDATYKTNNYRYPLFTLLVEDCDGVGQPIAFAIMTSEDQNHIEKFLEYFAECNDISKTQCVVVDKDVAEINAINKCWNNVKVLICYFHVLRAIDRHLNLLRLDQTQNELCCRYTQKMLNANTELEFNSAVESLKEVLCFYQYIVENWIPYKESITAFGRKCVRHLSNRTNNRIESFHGTLKKLIPSSRVDMDVLVNNLLGMSSLRSMESVHRDFENTLKNVTGNKSSPLVEKYFKICTRYSSNLLQNEVEMACCNGYTINKNHSTSEFVVTSPSTLNAYLIDLNFNCSCNFQKEMGLPCRHLFAVWIACEIDLFRPETIASRWLLSTNTPNLANVSQNTTISMSHVTPSLSRSSRFNSIMLLMKEIASYVADQPQNSFPLYYESMERLQKFIFNNTPEKALNALTNIESIYFELNNNALVSDSSKYVKASDNQPTVNCSVDTAIIASSDVASDVVAVTDFEITDFEIADVTINDVAITDVASTVKTNEAQTNVVSITQSNEQCSFEKPFTEELFFARIPKVRGRPAATKQRAFKMFGNKTTKPSSLMPKISESLQNSTTESSVGQFQQNDNCKECGFVDPPKKRTKTVPWIQCDHCNGWYHSYCSGLNKKLKSSEQFRCKQCG
ncbi:uncharacterized protein LOC124809264 [Hydra vulgaris]|uniref:uncharacterized protein LOC124809264 n=1 Tax=Hydra vulgaris TaxID=6087 RepID=UPI001F5F1956|nr:protein FAR1-RELATED SEQUENCE 5-like [Hydra vulgaris]